MIRVKDAVAISESGLLIDSVTNEVYVLNPLGITIFLLLKNQISEEDILNIIVSEFDIAYTQAELDLKFFMDELFNSNLIIYT